MNIGTIVLPMPKKTHGRRHGTVGGNYGLLELLGWLILEGRVQAHAIVVVLNKLREVFPQVFEVPIITGMDLLALERLHKAFATGVVIRIGWPAHARDELMLFQQLDIFPGRILHATIGVMDQAGCWLPGRESPFQRRLS